MRASSLMVFAVLFLWLSPHVAPANEGAGERPPQTPQDDVVDPGAQAPPPKAQGPKDREELEDAGEASAVEDDEEDGLDSSPARGKGAFGYLKDAMTFKEYDIAPQVDANIAKQWLIGALLTSVGGHLWGPGLAYGRIPKGAKTTPAVILGVLGTVMPYLRFPLVCCSCLCACPTGLFSWIPYVFAVCLPSTLVIFWSTLVVNQLVYTAVEAVFNWYLIPRAISFVYSDAFNSGGEVEEEEPAPRHHAKKKKHRR